MRPLSEVPHFQLTHCMMYNKRRYEFLPDDYITAFEYAFERVIIRLSNGDRAYFSQGQMKEDWAIKKMSTERKTGKLYE